MKELWDTFESEHTRFASNGFKTAAVKSRKAISEMKKLITDYRKQSLNETKKII
jgi:hypothetical protein|tara:strand:+ start:1038 stop:1199 length:162 start_codon:yes stop_codon:yes gene_type:complete